jgi:ketosteroid isomerase-like protein
VTDIDEHDEPPAHRAMTEGEIRELCETFFDAYQDRRVDILDRVRADDCINWHNVSGRQTTKHDNLSTFHASNRGQRRRTYDDRIVDAFHDGFVIRYQLRGVQSNGHTGSLWICIVGRVRDGKIVRIDEYMDSGKFLEWAGVAETGARTGEGTA